jgi:UDP-N-acetyl-D-glucosamine dehydrogenase
LVQDEHDLYTAHAVGTTRVVVIGQGYVGLPMALHAADNDMSVIGLDTDDALVAALNAGISHVGDVSADRLTAGLAGGAYAASTDPSCIADADVVLVCVPTPLSSDGGPDLSAVESAARVINAHVAPDTLVILESTSYPGTTEDVFAPLVLGDRLKLGRDVQIAFSPERIDPGNRTFGVRNIPKLVGGLTPDCTRAARKFYERFIDTVVEAKGAKEAEMAKLLENTFRHVNIALVNEMARFCHELDIDLWDAIDCAATKPFGYMPFRPGPGVGGHCIPIDPSYLSHHVRTRLGAAFRMVELAEEINTETPLYVATRVREALAQRGMTIDGSAVLLVGVTYKPDVADERLAPARPIADHLASWGASISYHDPYVPRWEPPAGHGEPLTSAADVYAAAGLADIVVLLQPHRSIDAIRLAAASAALLDTRGVVPPSTTSERL